MIRALLALSALAAAGHTARIVQTGTTASPSFTGTTTVQGLTTGVVSITVTDSTYTVPATVSYIFCDASGGAVTITTGSAASNFTGRVLKIKKTDSSANSCTFDPNGAATVDGSTTQTNTVQYQAFEFTSDGSNWFIF
jgi:hypothetical protein